MRRGDRPEAHQPSSPRPHREQRGRVLVPPHADPAGRLIVESLTLRDFRSYAAAEAELRPGLVLIVGENGSGKTSVLEAIHVATQGFSPRARADRYLVRQGQHQARVRVRAREGAALSEVEALVRRDGGKELRLNGRPVESIERVRADLPVLVFTPDRLALVKAGPVVRRAYLDRVLARLQPTAASLPREYAFALAQRNAALRRAAAGLSGRDAIAPWSRSLANLGSRLVAARRRVVEELAPLFSSYAEALGVGDARLSYQGDAPTLGDLESRLGTDLDRGVTTVGPHLHDLGLARGQRDLRMLGSQGEQRLAVLALLLAEREALARARGLFPPLLLDDVLSELDAPRRRALIALLPASGQTLVTSADRQALPANPAQTLVAGRGQLREA
ncbi:MAG: hypothetical protein C4305_00435 [Thermoleophilia bacterium]